MLAFDFFLYEITQILALIMESENYSTKENLGLRMFDSVIVKKEKKFPFWDLSFFFL